MSLYNMIAGRNDQLVVAFSVILNMRIDQVFPRFRDIFLQDDDCEYDDYDAIIYTRMGGRNFDCWEDNKKNCDCQACELKKMIARTPWIIGHYDDVFDKTFKNIVIKLTPEQRVIWKTIQQEGLKPYIEKVKELFPECKIKEEQKDEKRS